MASPAEMLRQYLVGRGVVIMPGDRHGTLPYSPVRGDDLYLCFVSGMPDEPDLAVELRDMAGLSFGTLQRGHKYLTHPGVRAIVRGLYYSKTYDFTSSLAVVLSGVGMSAIVVDGAVHYVQSVYRASNIFPLGEEAGRKRELFSVDFRVAFQDQEPAVG